MLYLVGRHCFFLNLIIPHSESIERQTLSENTSAGVTVHTMDMNCYIHSMKCTPAVVCSDRVCLSMDSDFKKSFFLS